MHSLKLINKVLLLEDTKSKLLIKDDINDVLLMMEDTKYSARKKHLVIPNLSTTGQLHGITITFKTLDTLVLKDTLVLSDKRR